MKRVLLTAFGPFEPWKQNASWLALQALTCDMPDSCQIITRLYPVNFEEARARMASDLATPYDAVLHLGQSAGSTMIELEAFALNARRDASAIPMAPIAPPNDPFQRLEPTGPVAYQSALPLADMAEQIRAAGIPARVSMHAGSFLCNAALYWSHYFAEVWDRPTLATFIHLPLDVSQVAGAKNAPASMSSEIVAHAIRVMLEQIETLPTPTSNTSRHDPKELS